MRATCSDARTVLSCSPLPCSWLTLSRPAPITYMLAAMDPGVTAIKRAFTLARSGKFANVEATRRKLLHEGYRNGQIIGPLLVKQLNDVIREKRGEKRGPKAPKARSALPT